MAEVGAFAQAARGVGIQHLGVGRLAEMAFPLPSLAEQERIVAEAHRRLAELSAAQAALASALARTFEQDLLVLEAAVSGALVETEAQIAEWEDHAFEPATKLLINARTERERSLFSALGPDIAVPAGSPPGWAVPTVGEVGEVRLGRHRAPQHERGDHPTPYLRAANITADGLDLSSVLRMNFAPEERRIYELYKGDIVLSEASGSAAHVGRPAVWQGEIPGCCFQNTVIRFRPAAASSAYALLVFRHLAESGAFGRAARGVGIQHLGASRFAAMAFPLPPRAEQDRIVAEAETRLAASRGQRDAVQASLARFTAMRREIWAVAVNGRLVQQDLADEAASALLARLGPPSEAVRLEPSRTRKEETVTKAPRGSARKSQTIKPLAAVLAEADRAVPLPELFASAGYDRDSAGDIERFYLALRDEIGQALEPVGDARENAPVVLRDAS